MRVHLHTADPDGLIRRAEALGRVVQLQIRDMSRQHAVYLQRRERQGEAAAQVVAVDRLVEHVAGFDNLEELAVENTACPQEAEALVERLGALFPRERIHRSKMTPVIGTHTGPGLLLVATLGDRSARKEAEGGGR